MGNAVTALPSGPLVGGRSWYEGDKLNMTAGPTSDWWKKLALETMRGKAQTTTPSAVMAGRMVARPPMVNSASPADHGVEVDHGKDANGLNVNRQLVPVGLGAQMIPGMGMDKNDPRQVPGSSAMDVASLARPSMAGVGPSTQAEAGSYAGTTATAGGGGGGNAGGGGGYGTDPFAEAVMASVLKGAAQPAPPAPMTPEERSMMMMRILFGNGGR